MEPRLKHLDCRNFAPIDVVKGLCHARKEPVLADGACCELFDKLPKCKHCASYRPGLQPYLGMCVASPSRPMTYPDLIGVTCEWFAWKPTA